MQKKKMENKTKQNKKPQKLSDVMSENGRDKHESGML